MRGKHGAKAARRRAAAEADLAEKDRQRQHELRARLTEAERRQAGALGRMLDASPLLNEAAAIAERLTAAERDAGRVDAAVGDARAVLQATWDALAASVRSATEAAYDPDGIAALMELKDSGFIKSGVEDHLKARDLFRGRYGLDARRNHRVKYVDEPDEIAPR